MNTIMQLRKICNHPYLFLDNWDEGPIDDMVRWKTLGSWG